MSSLDNGQLTDQKRLRGHCVHGTVVHVVHKRCLIYSGKADLCKQDTYVAPGTTTRASSDVLARGVAFRPRVVNDSSRVTAAIVMSIVGAAISATKVDNQRPLT